jgi:hypothetical protein
MTMLLECPICKAGLAYQRAGEFDSWACPNGHGLGFTLSEAYGRLEDDEIHALWAAAKGAAAGDRNSPISGQSMVVVAITVDGAGSASATVDVDVANEFLWFDTGEFDKFPAAPSPKVAATDTPGESVEIARITKDFGDSIDKIDDEHDDSRATDELVRRLPDDPLLSRASGILALPRHFHHPAG